MTEKLCSIWVGSDKIYISSLLLETKYGSRLTVKMLTRNVKMCTCSCLWSTVIAITYTGSLSYRRKDYEVLELLMIIITLCSIALCKKWGHRLQKQLKFVLFIKVRSYSYLCHLHKWQNVDIYSIAGRSANILFGLRRDWPAPS